MAAIYARKNALHTIATLPTVNTSMKIYSAGHRRHMMTTAPMMTMKIIFLLMSVHIQRH